MKVILSQILWSLQWASIPLVFSLVLPVVFHFVFLLYVSLFVHALMSVSVCLVCVYMAFILYCLCLCFFFKISYSAPSSQVFWCGGVERCFYSMDFVEAWSIFYCVFPPIMCLSVKSVLCVDKSEHLCSNLALTSFSPPQPPSSVLLSYHLCYRLTPLMYITVLFLHCCSVHLIL